MLIYNIMLAMFSIVAIIVFSAMAIGITGLSFYHCRRERSKYITL